MNPDATTETTKEAEKPMTYYKVLDAEGQSAHGGSLQWSLPTQKPDGSWTKGKWHKVTGEIELCSNGLHLTNEPAKWWLENARCFVVEYRGESQAGDDKIAVREARLICELSADELADVRVFREGTHSVSAGYARASGSATVRASGSATVEASGSATVRASGSATVEASGSATVRAYDSATVRASGSATVEAYDSATVLTFWKYAQPVIVVADMAVWIDRRSSPPTIHGAVQLAEVSR